MTHTWRRGPDLPSGALVHFGAVLRSDPKPLESLEEISTEMPVFAAAVREVTALLVLDSSTMVNTFIMQQ